MQTTQVLYRRTADKDDRSTAYKVDGHGHCRSAAAAATADAAADDDDAHDAAVTASSAANNDATLRRRRWTLHLLATHQHIA